MRETINWINFQLLKKIEVLSVGEERQLTDAEVREINAKLEKMRDMRDEISHMFSDARLRFKVASK